MFLTSISSMAVFLCIFLLIYVFGSEWMRSPSSVWNRFRKRWNLGSGGSPARSVVQVLSSPEEERRFIPIFRPSTDLQRRQLKLELSRAGFNLPRAAAIYLSLRVYLAAFGFVLGTGWHAGVYGWSLQDPVSGLVGGAVGYLLPEVAMRWLQKRRRGQLRKALPDALDLLSMSISCGNGVDAALRDTTAELAKSSPMLAGEFALFLSQLDMGCDRRVALQELALRSGLREMTSFTSVLVQSYKMGSGIAQTLQEQARYLRIQRRQRAEERAQAVAVQMIFPLVLFIFPGVFVVLVGPAAISIIRDVLALQ